MFALGFAKPQTKKGASSTIQLELERSTENYRHAHLLAFIA